MTSRHCPEGRTAPEQRTYHVRDDAVAVLDCPVHALFVLAVDEEGRRVERAAHTHQQQTNEADHVTDPAALDLAREKLH